MTTTLFCRYLLRRFFRPGFADHGAQVLTGESQPGITQELCSHRLVGIDDGMSTAAVYFGQGIESRGHHQIAAQQQICLTRRYAGGMNIVGPRGDNGLETAPGFGRECAGSRVARERATAAR